MGVHIVNKTCPERLSFTCYVKKGFKQLLMIWNKRFYNSQNNVRLTAFNGYQFVGDKAL